MTNSGNSVRYRAKWIIPLDEEPIENGWIEVVGDSIVARGTGESSSSDIDLGNVAIIPTPVNAHTHLDLSGVTEQIPLGTNFPDWLTGVVGWRRNHPTDISDDIRLGIDELTRAGTGIVGDIATTGLSASLMGKSDLCGTVFREVVGLREQRFEPLWLDAIQAQSAGNQIASLSPHAPYSTSPEVYRRSSRIGSRVPIATHWLESPEEREFLLNASGPFRKFLERIGAWTDDWKPTADFWEQYLSAGRWTLVHANYLTPEEITMLSASRWRDRIAAIVYCPRTHAYFGHAPHPFRELLNAGVTVALGTDSRASNPDLSVFREACFVAEHFPDVDPRVILRMLTASGAAAIGWQDRYRTDLKGAATFAVVELEAMSDRKPFSSLLSSQSRIVGLMVAGKWTYHPND
jgi:cytosine/adenosine deaminase-related metal-dependent hydrolase